MTTHSEIDRSSTGAGAGIVMTHSRGVLATSLFTKAKRRSTGNPESMRKLVLSKGKSGLSSYFL